MKLLATGIAAAMLMASPAFADALDWSGLYIGAHGGWAQDKFDPSTPLLPDEGAAGKEVKGLLSETEVDGWLGGAQIGINRQFGLFVVGFEADISGGDVKDGNDLKIVDDTGNYTSSIKASVESDLELFGTARARLGYLVQPNLLVYGTGGLAWGKFDTKVDAKLNDAWMGNPWNSAKASFSGDSSHVGWTIGAGAEWALNDRWSIKADYLYADLGDEDVFVDGPVTINGNTGKFGIPAHVEHELHFVRTGLNWKF